MLVAVNKMAGTLQYVPNSPFHNYILIDIFHNAEVDQNKTGNFNKNGIDKPEFGL